MAQFANLQSNLKKAPRVFWTYFISYLSVTIVPILILSIASYNFTVSTLIDELSQATMHSSKQKNAAVEKWIQEIQSAAIRIGLDGRIYSYANNPSNLFLQNEIKDLLKTSANSIESVQSIDLYMTGTNQIITSDGYTRTYNGLEKDIWIKEGAASTESGLWLNTREVYGTDLDRIVTYVVKVPVQHKETKGLAAIHVHESILIDILKKMEGNPYTSTYIADRAGNVVTSYIQAPIAADRLNRLLQ
ncbi:MAG: AraC family transcriptional regulator, partial [Paenibacillus sp.]|nr:AraC family transcriptional regulator [Paenibacillus sp.]